MEECSSGAGDAHCPIMRCPQRCSCQWWRRELLEGYGIDVVPIAGDAIGPGTGILVHFIVPRGFERRGVGAALHLVQASPGFSTDHYSREILRGIVGVVEDSGHVVVVPLMAIQAVARGVKYASRCSARCPTNFLYG